jgi:hypothetical protein
MESEPREVGDPARERWSPGNPPGTGDRRKRMLIRDAAVGARSNPSARCSS